MSEYDRTVYIARWECGIADDWCIIGTYYYEDAAIEKARQFQEENTDGDVYVDTVILPAR